jgi:hypothetical protein
MINHSSLAALVAGLLFATASQAQSISITFDALSSGTPANLAAPAGVSFGEATWSPDLDADGDVIAGTERWRLFEGSSPILVRNPSFYDRGSAPSGLVALDGVFQPTLIRFSSPQMLARFSVTLDKDTYGDPSAAIEFYRVGSAGNTLLASIPANQTSPGFTAALAAPVSGVDMVLLPSGALYDNIQYSSIPEPSSVALSLVGLAGFGTFLFLRRTSVQR